MASSWEPKRIYHVFLSFRGSDVRNNFVSHLYRALDQKGIYTFVDGVELRKGEHNSSAPAKVIEDSRIAIIVFSDNFASSPWCLEEVAKIMECEEQRDLRVFPVFYKVEPREVRSPRQRYREAMNRHESKFGKDSEKVKRWEKALFNAGSLSGWHFDDGDESELIQGIVKEISSYLNRTPLHVAKNPVGIDSRVVKLKSMLKLESDDDVVMLGLWGQRGVGKTTLARALYNAIFRQFEGSCFLENIGEASKDSKHLVLLQEKLLSQILSLQHRSEVSSVDRGTNLIQERLCHNKVLLVLDDVDDLWQLNALAGEGKLFGSGSRIIFTTRNRHLLTSHGIDHVYEVQTLDEHEARELLIKHAFTKCQHIEIRTDLVDRVLYHVVDHARGLPLLLVVLGSFLCARREDEWERTLDGICCSPNMTYDLLKISYDGLEANEKEIFLDIACFFNGRNKEYVKKVLNSCGFEAAIGLENLIERSLISIDECGLIKMPELIQLMGMDIVRRECPDDPGTRSRLWLYDDVVHVLSRDMGDCAVKAIMLEPPKPTELFIRRNTFTKMSRLRLLIVRNVHSSSQDPVCLPDELRWFEWPGWVPSVPKLSSGPKKSGGLDMSKSNIRVKPKQFKTSVATIEHVIGIDDRVKEVIKLLDIDDDEVGVRIVGIHGTNGIGKTTIAKAVYDRLASYFGGCSFLAEIGETAKNGGGIQFVQSKLISDILK